MAINAHAPNAQSADAAVPAPRRRLALLALATLALALVAAAAADLADGRSAHVLGKTKHTPKPSCPAPEDPSPAQECQALGEVTGFQQKAGGKRAIMKLPVDAKIVAWSVRMRRPDSSSRAFFEERLSNERFGDDPVARIGVLRKTGGKRFELTKQSDPVNLKGFFNETPIITLDKPIPARKGRVVALTVPTWVTNFAHSIRANNVWKASRSPKRCGGDTREEALENLTERSRPHMKKGSERVYGCAYSGARLVYWVYYVPREKKR